MIDPVFFLKFPTELALFMICVHKRRRLRESIDASTCCALIVTAVCNLSLTSLSFHRPTSEIEGLENEGLE